MKHIILELMLGLAAFAPAWAGSISMQTSMTGSTRGDVFYLKVAATNRGDESAYNVQVKADASMAPSESKLESVLPVGKTHSAILSQPLKGLLPGRYPFVARILYADANLYPFSALAISYFVHQKDAASRVIGVLEKTQIYRQGRLTLKIKSVEDQAQQLHVRVLLPQEISTELPSQDVQLLPLQETVLKFPIRNFSALEGSVYTVYAIIEYKSGGLHYTSIAPGTVTLRAPAILGADWIWGSLILVGLLLIVIINVRPFRKRK